jgi:hypothetical protein
MTGIGESMFAREPTPIGERGKWRNGEKEKGRKGEREKRRKGDACQTNIPNHKRHHGGAYYDSPAGNKTKA